MKLSKITAATAATIALALASAGCGSAATQVSSGPVASTPTTTTTAATTPVVAAAPDCTDINSDAEIVGANNKTIAGDMNTITSDLSSGDWSVVGTADTSRLVTDLQYALGDNAQYLIDAQELGAPGPVTPAPKSLVTGLTTYETGMNNELTALQAGDTSGISSGAATVTQGGKEIAAAAPAVGAFCAGR